MQTIHLSNRCTRNVCDVRLKALAGIPIIFSSRPVRLSITFAPNISPIAYLSEY
ncbi:hypothetical protein HBI56_223680 [Parastagonospora nodorum]|nr:hypothetical protein HBH53_134770 [Parastagonospora nodorum]KAH3983644.1 hypothetical protein HBH52_065270 [Parastagonospora nodorum]KAH3985694.1 hypothetical protein HBH51_024050 [Parastagonospora nodorum]KAH4003850.1 hypothetical protein HBI10_063230 [Parastagonospora nodorum]KAH4028705.1 hypothetical protein HBI13_039180 [Parastagonospora nodorum]